MKIEVSLSIGLCEKKGTLEIPDEELAGLSDGEIADVCNEYLDEWSAQYICTGYEIVEG